MTHTELKNLIELSAKDIDGWWEAIDAVTDYLSAEFDIGFLVPLNERENIAKCPTMRDYLRMKRAGAKVKLGRDARAAVYAVIKIHENKSRWA